MQKYVKDGDSQSIDTIAMNVDELLYFLRTIQNVNKANLVYLIISIVFI